MSAFKNKTSHPEAYTSLLKVYQETNLTKKRDIAIREAQSLWNELKGNKNLLEKTIELLKLEAQASSTTIAKDTTEDITKDITDDTTDDTSKKKETLAQTKLKEELIRLNRELSQLQDLENKAVGRPCLEEAQPGLLKTILHLVSSDGQADKQRHSKIIQSVKTLDQLHAALEQINYKISRSATYLRLLPKWFNTKEEKQHDLNIKEMVSLLGPQSVLTIFQDDKARIPFGLAAANKQAPILMRVEYRVELPDHDWVVTKKHKLILSIYVILEIQS
ncbi:16017_t:CDS:2, partial [Gigaspora margarita]